jgi:hypothetical protein
MTSFRYDVVLRRGGITVAPDRAIGAPEPCTIDALNTLLHQEPASLRVTGVRNSRLVHAVRTAQRVASGAVADIADLQRPAEAPAAGLDPEDLRTLDARYEAVVEFSSEQPDLMDVTFRHRVKHPSFVRASRDTTTLDVPAAYTNTPARPTVTGNELIPVLREQARQTLPEYMIPSAFVIMDALPLTPNGKIDRRALPEPERPRTQSTRHEPPSNDVERGIVGVLQDLLGATEVGVDDNFFDLGANSLMMVQASIRLRAALGRPVPLVRMFQHPTARALATALGDAAAPAGERDVKQSKDRAQIRREAMQRLRGGTRR